MAADATGIPTSLGIPKFLTSADAPSGNGGNAQMDSIDALLQARVNRPSGVATGDVPVWNGTTFIVPSGSRDGTKFLRDDGSWAKPSSGVFARKVTSKTVNTTVTDTDLLNGEITITANSLGTNNIMRLTAWGDFLNNKSNQDIPIFSLKLGATTLLKTALAGATVSAISASRWGWKIVCDIVSLGSASSQWASMNGTLGFFSTSTGTSTALVGAAFGTGEGLVQTVRNSAASVPSILTMIGGNATAVDTTANNVLALSVINALSDALYETKLIGAIVEIV